MVTRRVTELVYRAPGAEETDRQIERLGETGERAGRRIKRGAGEASTGLKAVNAASVEVQSGLGGLAASAGPAGRVLSTMGPAGVAAAAGVAVLTLGVGASTRAFGAWETQMLTIEGVLRATGTASGKTAAEISALARDIGDATLANADQVRQAAGQLLTFRAISGDTFDRALRGAQDLAATGFGSITSASVQLGKALENPKQGVSALTEVGVSFTQAQRDMIATLVDTGRAAEAQTIILDVLERQVGGAGAAQAGGLAGASDSLSENWTRLLENLGNTGPGDAAAEMLRLVSAGISEINEELEKTPLDRLNSMVIASAPFDRDAFGRESETVVQLRNEAFGDIETDLLARAAAEAAAKAAETEQRFNELSAAVAGFADQADPAAKAAREFATAQDVLTTAVEAGVITSERAAEIEAALAARLDGTAKASERLASQRERAIGGLRFEVERLQALSAAHRQGAQAIARTEAETKALTLARRLGLEEGSAELAQIRELVDQQRVLNDEIAAATEAEEARRAAMEETRRETEEAMQDIVDFGRDIFSDWFDDLTEDWGGLWGKLAGIAGNALSNLAARAAATVIAPVIGPVASQFGLGGLVPSGLQPSALQASGLFPTGDILGAGSSILFPGGGIAGGFGGLNQFGFEFLGTGLPGLEGGLTGASLTGILGAGSLGFLGGGILAGLTGGNQLGGSIGGGLGAGLGFAVGGPIGALIGGALGGFGGSLFGGGPSSEFNAFTADLASGSLVQGTTEIRSGAGQQHADAARRLAESFAQQIAPAVLQALGGSLPGSGTDVSFGVSTSGVQIQGLGGAPTGFGLTQDQALAEATRRLVGIAEGVSEDLQAAVAASSATTTEGLIADIDLARFVLGEDQATLSDALEAIADELDTMRDRALGLGLAMEDVTAAVDRASEAMLGELLGGIEAFQQSLAISGLAPVSPAERFATAQGLFGDLTSQALAGDLAAIQAFPAAAQEFLGIAREIFASGPDFAAVFAEVNRTLNTVLDIPSFATGTAGAPSGLALVGERGPELVRFRGGEQVIEAGQTRTAFAGGFGGAVDRQGGQASAERQAIIDLLEALLRGNGRMTAALEDVLADVTRLRAA